MNLHWKWYILGILSFLSLDPSAWARDRRDLRGAYFLTSNSNPPPSAPPKLSRKIPEDPFLCKRFFVYQGRKLVCDSHRGRDAENLRPILSEVPEAIAELDAYQRKRRNLNQAAYVGTAGMVLYLGRNLITSLLFPEFDPRRDTYSRWMQWAGLGMVGGTVIYGLNALKASETHLERSIELYNQVRPDRPIQLQFQTEF
jgi:hypothetical protein